MAKTPVRRDRALAMKAGVRGSSPAAPTTVLKRKSGWNHKGKVIPKDAEMFGFLTTKLLRMER